MKLAQHAVSFAHEVDGTFAGASPNSYINLHNLRVNTIRVDADTVTEKDRARSADGARSDEPREIEQRQQGETEPARADAHARAVIILRELVVAAGNRVQVEQAHRLAVELGGRDAVVVLAELVDGPVDEVAVQDQVDLAVAGEVVAQRADLVHTQRGIAVLGRLQHVVLVEAQNFYRVVAVQVELLDRVDLIADHVQRLDVLQPEEGVLADDAQVARLDHQLAHISATRERDGVD